RDHKRSKQNRVADHRNTRHNQRSRHRDHRHNRRARNRSEAASVNSTSVDYDCSDFKTQASAQDFFDSRGYSASHDPYDLDGDNDGTACEDLPSGSADAQTPPEPFVNG